MDTNALSRLAKFDGEEFGVWRAQIEALLTFLDLAHVLSEHTETEKNVPQFVKADQKVKSIILLGLDNKHAKHVLKCTSSFEMWQRLKSIHERKSIGSKTILQKQFYDMHMNPGESAIDWLTRVEYAAGQLDDVGVQIMEDSVVGKIVSGLGRSDNNFISSWAATDESSQTLENLTARLLNEDTMRSRYSNKDSIALAATSSERNHGSHGSRYRKSPGKNNKQKKKTLSKEELADLKSQSVCRECKQKGHWAVDCPAKGNQPGKNEANDVVGALVAESNITICNGDSWALDSAATDHITNDISHFLEYRELEVPKTIRYRGGESSKAVGIGSVKLACYFLGVKKHSVIMNNVPFVPDIRRKLISFSRCTDNGNKGVFDTDTITMQNQKGVDLFVLIKKDGLYFAQILVESSSALVTKSTAPNLSVWHERFAHVNHNYPKIMNKNSVVEKFDVVIDKPVANQGETVVCEPCKFGKQIKKTFKSKTTPRATKVGQRVHVDISGNISTPSLSNFHYFILYKDEFSTFRLIYFLHDRSEAYNTLRKAVVTIENESGNKVTKIVSDRGSEFTSAKAQGFLLNNKFCMKLLPHTARPKMVSLKGTT